MTQTVKPRQIIVVNDGSTDGTAAVLQTFGSQVVVVEQENRGLSAARNCGAKRASAKWLAFLDADDTWLPEKLECQLRVAEANDVAMVYTDRYNVGDRGDLPEIQSHIQHLYSGDVFEPLLLSGNHITASSVMIRTDVFWKLDGFQEDLTAGEDWDLWIRVAESSRIAVCERPLVRYRFHAGMMSGDPRRMRKARRDVVERALARSRGRLLPRRTRRRIMAATARTNGWDAARRGAWSIALNEYGRALVLRPFYGPLYRDLARLAVAARLALAAITW